MNKLILSLLLLTVCLISCSDTSHHNTLRNRIVGEVIVGNTTYSVVKFIKQDSTHIEFVAMNPHNSMLADSTKDKTLEITGKFVVLKYK